MSRDGILQQHLSQLLEQRPYLRDFFAALAIPLPRQPQTLQEFLQAQTAEHLADYGLDHPALTKQSLDFIAHMERFQKQGRMEVTRVLVRAGQERPSGGTGYRALPR